MSQPDRTDIDRIQELIGERYQLSWIIGRGGMSTVWLAFDSRTEQDVAIKVLKPEYTDNEEFRTRFRAEAETSEEFRSPNVVETYDYEEVHDPAGGSTFCYMVMEYIRGESLADVLSRERTLPPRLAIDVMAQVALGLDTIHQNHMVHRDIKPGNLLITPDGLVKITDFGIAKAAAAVPLTQTGMVVGTAQYVSPEQAQGQQVAATSDIYSLGVVAYEMLSGTRPFTGESTVSVAIKHISDAPPPLPDDVPAPIQELVSICLRKKPRARYADGAELAAAIQHVVEGQRPPQPHAVPPVDVDSQPFTEQLGQVATGSGTAVPPRQGPAEPSSAHAPVPPAGPRNAAGARNAAPANRGAAAAAPQKQSKDSSGKGPLIALGLVAALALGGIGYLLLANNDQPATNPETLTVTNEVTSESTQTEQPPASNTEVPEQTSTTTETQTTDDRETSTSETTQPGQPNQPGRTENPGNSGNSGTTPTDENNTGGNSTGNTGTTGTGTGAQGTGGLGELLNGASGANTTGGEGTANSPANAEPTQDPPV